MSNSYFHFKQFSIYSQEKGLRVTTDACLLGALAQHPKPLNIIDIGTGTGVIALMLAQRFEDANVDAIDIEKAVVEQATNNIHQSKFAKRIKLHHGDYLQHSLEKKFDLIVCNPPYFKDHLQKQSSEKNIAIHNETLNHKLLLKKAISDLKEQGIFYVILPPFEADQLMAYAKQLSVGIFDVIQIFNLPGKLYRKVIGFVNYQTEPTERTILIKNDDKNNTPEFQLLMSDFYLEDTQMYKNQKH